MSPRPPLGYPVLLHQHWQGRTDCLWCGDEGPWADGEPCPGRLQHGQETTALVAEVRRLRQEAELSHAVLTVPEVYVGAVSDAVAEELERLRATTLPTRVTLPNGTTVEIVDVRARYTLPTGGSWHESMSLATWRRQGNVREELRDSGGGGDREG